MESHRAKLVVGTIIVAVVFGFIMTVTRGERSRDLVMSVEPIDPSDEVTVYIGGAVESPGLYSLPRGSRVAEVLDLAGVIESADTQSLQLAQVLEDEQSIMVPEAHSAVDAGNSEVSDQSLLEQSAARALVDINAASENELQELPGIGPALASQIRERRESDGPFSSLDELSDISGISERMVDELRAFAIVGQ